jgi:hypothetical protein
MNKALLLHQAQNLYLTNFKQPNNWASVEPNYFNITLLTLVPY